MKKLLIILLFCPILGIGQINKGKIMLNFEGLGYDRVNHPVGFEPLTYTSFNLSLTNNNTYYNNSILRNISIGGFVTDKICLGTAFDYNHQIYEDEMANRSETRSLFFAPLFRYYIQMSDNRYIYPEVQFGGGGVNYKSTGMGDEGDWFFLTSIGFGSSIFIGKNFAIEPAIRYRVNYFHDEVMNEGYNLFTSMLGYSLPQMSYEGISADDDWTGQQHIFSIDIDLTVYF
tara:strand:+ start:60 stop:749 length:690 start_codon:yes stop_codon:yes gene_type:complete